jgi:hypothetical protein
MRVVKNVDERVSLKGKTLEGSRSPLSGTVGSEPNAYPLTLPPAIGGRVIREV